MRSTTPISNRTGCGVTPVIGAVALAACSHVAPQAVTEHVFTPVSVAVPAACVAPTGRPVDVAPLNRSIPPEQWAALAPGAKAQAVRAQAGRRMNHDDALSAATSGCR